MKNVAQGMQESRESWKRSKENTLHETEEGCTLHTNEADTGKKKGRYQMGVK